MQVSKAMAGGWTRDPDDEPSVGKSIERDVVSKATFAASEREGKPNFGLLVLEIGRWAARKNFPENPPTWALNACKRYDKKRWASTRKVITPQQGPGETPGDGEILNLIADIFIDPDVRKDVGLGAEIRGIPLREKIFTAALRKMGKVDIHGDVRRGDLKRIREAWSADCDYRMEMAGPRFIRNHAKKHGYEINSPQRISFSKKIEDEGTL